MLTLCMNTKLLVSRFYVFMEYFQILAPEHGAVVGLWRFRPGVICYLLFTCMEKVDVKLNVSEGNACCAAEY